MEIKSEEILQSDLGKKETRSFSREKFTEEILEKIQFPDKDKPKARISDFGLDQYNHLLANLESTKSNSNEKAIIANIRGWNKEKATIVNKDGVKILGLDNLLNNFNQVRKEIPYLKGAFLVIDQNKEQGDKTEKNLQELYKETGSDFPIVPIYLDGYCWTSGLNIGAALAKQTALNENIDLERIMMMPYSFDVSLTNEELKKCKRLIDDGDEFFFTLRYTRDYHHPMAEQNRANYELKIPEDREVINKFKKLLKEPEKEEYDPLVYSMRNTFNFIPLSRLTEMGGWNPACSGDRYEFFTETEDLSQRPAEDRIGKKVIAVKGGMEDAEFFSRIIQKAARQLKSKNLEERSDGRKTFEGFLNCLKNPIFYEDASWKQIHEVARNQKTTRETSAFGKILAYMPHIVELRLANDYSATRKVKFDSSGRVPENIQEFKI